ncbi:hypothetical protein EBT31_16610, partial [bacterium]|nr:hypothetical protein [bacterium]
DKALNDAAMGMTSPETQAIARAYEQFYGPTSRQQQITRLSIANAVDKHMPDKLPDALSVAPDVVEAVKKTLLHVVRVYAGPDVVVRFENGIVKRIDYGAHGQAGKMIEVDGGYTVNLDGVMHGDPVKEVIEFSKVATYDYAGQSDVDFFNAKTSTAFHEIFHIIQERYLSSRQLQVVDGVMARVKLAMAEINRGGTDAPLERQAQAFEPYMRGVVEDVSPSLTMLGIAPSVQREIAQRAATGQGLDKFQAMFGSGFFKAIEILDDLLNFIERVYNGITIKQWSSLRDIYAQSAAGKIQAEGATRGNVFEVSDLPGKVTDFMRYKQGDPEWALRVLELIKQDVAGPGANSPGEIALMRGVKAANEAIAKGLGQGADDAQIIQDLLNESRSSLPARLQATPPPEPPRGIPGVPSPEDPEWQKRFAAVYRENAERLAAGEITREELLMLSHFQKAESPSGRPYTAKSEELAPGLAAMSQVLPDRPTESGIPVMNIADVVKQNQEWFNSHGLNKDAILAGLDSVTRGFAGHEHGALNRAMFYADHLQVAAQVEAGKWLNGGADADAATLNSMIAAADKARRMHKAVMEVTRPWGQLGAEMQMGRDYVVPAIAG